MRRTVYAPTLFRFLATLLILLFAAGFWSFAGAQESAEEQPGGLMLRAKGSTTELPAVRLGTDIKAEVSGQVARVTVTQAFRNTSDEWMEATYLYPLPENGAVDTLKMVVGERIIIGRIKPREEAREIYEEAMEKGQKAGLVEQHRPNLFRNSVANIGPGETVLVQIEFQAPVRQVEGRYELRLPLVAGLRYVPPHTITGTAAVKDALDVNAPIAHPSISKDLNPVSISVALAPGFAPTNIDSPYHDIAISRTAQTARVELGRGEVPANRDFVLRWETEGSTPKVGLFRQSFDGEEYVMATITPPTPTTREKMPPREMIFVIDNSGSMAGESMPAARRSLVYALSTLRPEDRFNIIRFDDSMTMLHSDAVQATPRNVSHARRYAENLEAQGGTNMLPALRAALRDNDPQGKAIRQIIFLTDGGLSNEREMMGEISTSLGRSRVFMVGIGSAPNSHLMRRMAEAGRGTFTHVGRDGEAESEMRRMLNRLSKPVVTQLAVSVSGNGLDLTPRVLPDLYAGEPLVLLGRTAKLSGRLTVTGLVGKQRWSNTLDLDEAQESGSVARLWARRRISDIEAQRWSYQIDGTEADSQVEALGMQFHIVTDRTSLVAVDETPSRPEGQRLTREELPLLLPAGWDFDHLFGQQLSASHAVPPSEAEEGEQLDLPRGSLPFRSALFQGLLLMLLGLLALLWSRRMRVA
ncbi:marine proteobacterial sortase target protein [Qipengyuania vesicularis]|uniref:marine proteobacterial sortase target protein n=1 Tax=Qipengyuania vesicularis TaxID=2867232 RepID=UPI001C880638|nr:marine proteobacterial sortase target protein [Qipengyuania vesicularis]MBX7527565.1 marine proteobacterial sortase target protein [Qipengyuania vesicularis]